MRFTHTSSRWGIMYRHRFYIDGRRVTQHAFEIAFIAYPDAHRAKQQNGRATSYGWRTDWEF